MTKLILIVVVLGLFSNFAMAYPQRIVSAMPSITEILFALNLGDRVVGVTQNCNYPLEARKKETIGRDSVNLEKIISIKPDLVLMIEDAQTRDIEKLKSHGLPVVTINPRTVSDVIASIIKIGEITGATKEAEKLSQNMKEKIKNAELKILPWTIKKVFVAVGYRPLIGAGNGTFINDVIYLSGGINVLENARSPYPQINFEDLSRLAPQVLVFPKGAAPDNEILVDPRLNKSGKILFIDPDLLFRPGPRIVDAISEIAGFINK